MKLKQAKSMLVFVHGDNLADMLDSLRAFIADVEKGEAWEDNCLAPDLNVEWDSDSRRITSMAQYFQCQQMQGGNK